MLRVLVACEYSGRVRDAFRKKGHDAWSCDLLPTDSPSSFHLQGDVRAVLGFEWDLMIAFPPCTYLCRSGARWWPGREREQTEALQFVRDLMNAPIERIAIENPIGRIGTQIRPADQILQPWEHGHPETKATCLWLKNLPLLQPSNIVDGRENRCHRIPPSANRWKLRSLTYMGVAKSMAEQWG